MKAKRRILISKCKDTLFLPHDKKKVKTHCQWQCVDSATEKSTPRRPHAVRHFDFVPHKIDLFHFFTFALAKKKPRRGRCSQLRQI